jgi:hypothetical protein
MILNILLTLLLITFIVFIVMIYIWWRNFGSDLIKSTKNIMKINNQMIKNRNNGKTPNISDQIKVISDFFNKRNLK